MIAQEIISGASGVSGEAITAAGTGILAVTTAFKSIKRVSPGEKGIRMRFGRAKMRDGKPVIVGSGMHGIIPFTHGIENMDIRDQSTEVAELFIDRSEQYRVLASFVWRVSPEGDNPYKARFLVEGVENVVPHICFGALRTVMTTINEKQMIDAIAVGDGVRQLCEQDLEAYGTEMRRLNLHSVARSVGSMLRPAGITPEPGNGVGPLAIASGAIPDLAAS